MENKEISFLNDNEITESGTTKQNSTKQRKVNARKRVEDYIAEKELQENIRYFDLEY